MPTKKTTTKDKPAAGGPDGGMTMPTPGPEHAMLQTLCGDWDAVVHVGGQTSKASLRTRAHGGFFTVDDYTGDFMGTPFFGHGINGYDPTKKRFFTVWTDSMAPSPLVLWGTYDAKKKQLVSSGEGVGMDGKTRMMTTTWRFKDADHWEFVFGEPGAPDGVRMEYTRKKK